MVLFKGVPAGILVQHDDGSFTFQYTKEWMNDTSKPAISLTLPKTENEYNSSYLLPFFFHLLPEGTNRQVITQNLRIDQDDDFGLLLNTAKVDTIGAVTITKMEEQT